MLNAVAPAEAARLRDVDERALAGVAEQPVLADAGDEEVGKAVVVVVADGDAHAVHLDVEARRARHVGERAVAVVAIEPQRRSLRRVARPVHAVDQQDVLPAVGVVVEKRAAGAQRLGQELAAVGAAVVAELEAGRAGDVDEAEAEVAPARAAPTPTAGARRATPAPHAPRRNSRRFTAGSPGRAACA